MDCFDYNILCQTNRLEELSVWIKASYLPPWVIIYTWSVQLGGEQVMAGEGEEAGARDDQTARVQH